jgi:methylenetetrahydrofolate--tRNA-(uracil-5-)-methyltransferase
MNINFGLCPPLAEPPQVGPDGKKLRGPEKAVAKKRALCRRALDALEAWREEHAVAAE